MNKTDGSGTFWESFGGTAEFHNREARERAVGDILWSYVTDGDENLFKGALIDESESGLCILTLAPLRAGSMLIIYRDGRRALRDATVVWCKKISSDIYKSGLLLG